MGPLSSIFGGDDSDNSSSSSDGNVMGDATGDVSSALGLDVSNSSDSYSQDEDGNVSSDSSDTDVGLGTSTDGLLDTVGSATGSSDESSSD